MSVPFEVPKNDVDPELDWILLREQLDIERRNEEFIPPYRKNILLKYGLAATTLSFGYSLFNMGNTKKLFQGASSRIFFQFLTIVLFSAGYYDYTKSPEYAERNDSKKL